ncbi:MAG: hypothetical protein CVU65_08345 [Deltaproteobacteria bacterium HGW-Deltaproteobacteria-22]|jgi:hypothetical protein|nr:hypothetical protein [Myxococcota bacterium]PKN25578.1 MAG: hypothetical protein CVU65_08345 [Deltaproteobacteria bacterium HGW-Deltaproteobacteria-22]
MPKDDINRQDLKILQEKPSDEAQIMVKEDVYIIVTQAFCPNGHNLVGHGTHSFDGYPGICLLVQDQDQQGMVELSPFHGDHQKFGPAFADGHKVKVLCPVCKAEFEVIGKCTCDEGELRSIYLSPKRQTAHQMAVCDVWGCYHSRVIDNNEIFSEFVDSSWQD